jgi:tetratricopeptide (TPR) repeat protein
MNTKKMNEEVKQNKFQEIINDLNIQKFDTALHKLKILSIEFPNDKMINRIFASTYFKIMDWENSIKYNNKILSQEKDKFKIYTNIGVAFFKLGEIHKSIDAYNKAIQDKANFEMAHCNLAISYIEIGMYEKAMSSFLKILHLNKNNFFAQKNLIYLFNFISPKNINEHSLLKINNQINNISKNLEITEFDQPQNLKKILIESDNIIKKYYKNLLSEETQIYRKNTKDLNCKRHFGVFNKYNIIPKFCFSCYKIQINLQNVVDLIRLYFIFDNLYLENNNIRKCIVETRKNIKGNYKGYIYCREISEAENIIKIINDMLINKKLDNFRIEIKHGCTEYYKSYPEFEDINFNGQQKMNYKKDWAKNEFIFDNIEPKRSENNKKIWLKSIRGINLCDILIIKNWISYANLIGDNSYKLIYDNKLNYTFLSKAMSDQLNFRNNNLAKENIKH